VAATLFANVLANERVAERITQDYLLLAADRNALPNHEALYFAGDFGLAGMGVTGAVQKIPILGIHGFDLPQTVAEGALIVPQRLTDQSFTIVVARGGKAYQPSDEVRFTDSLGIFNSATFAQDAMVSHNLRLTNSLAGQVGGFSLNTTTSGVALTVTSVMATLILVETGSARAISAGQCIGILHTKQAGDLRSSIALSTAGAIQWQATPEQLLIRGNGYRGQIFGVDFWASGYVPFTNGTTDRAGGLFVRGGVAWARMSPTADMADQMVIGQEMPELGASSFASEMGGPSVVSPIVPVLFERDREGLAGLTSYVSASWVGTTRGFDTSPHRLGASLISGA
jgi:hypothetical protein